MKLNRDGTVEGTPEELAAHQTARDQAAASWPWPQIPEAAHAPRIFADICPCNPRRGGSGVCGCVIGNRRLDGSGSDWEVICTTTCSSSACL